jgi:hypothetical protein
MYVCLLRNTAAVADWCGVGRVTIDMLPDVALLEIFDCFVKVREEERYWPSTEIEAWHTLVHVCRTWRTIVLGSPHRLDLRLLCREKTPVKETLAVWPPLPIVIMQDGQPTQMDNIILALEHNDRVCRIDLLDVMNPELEEFLAAMQQPFPALTELALWYGYRLNDEDEMIEMPVIPESFLGGSAPRLQCLELARIPFPGLPKLLLSATDLVTLRIRELPHSGYISPEAMVRCLSTLTRLDSLLLGFKSPLSRPVRASRPPHPPTRSTLPTLTDFLFEGVSEYLEDFVARIDAPLLDSLKIRFFHQLIFDTPQLAQFFARTPNIQPAVDAGIVFFNDKVLMTSPSTSPRQIELTISCRQSDWQLSSLAQVCSSSLPEAFIPKVERLYIYDYENEYDRLRWQDDIEDSQWLEVLQPFTALKDLYVSTEFLPRFAPVFQELAGERVTEVLPALQSLFLEELHPSGPVWEAIEKFVAARQLAGHPIAVSHWD